MLKLGEVLHTDRYQVTYYLLNDSLYENIACFVPASIYITTTYGIHTLRGGTSSPLEKVVKETYIQATWVLYYTQ